MVQSKADRERQKLITDKCQALIEVLLKDEDNKYCVDCDAKGPRWASWNLGIFLCIRCAGIHRNLGVHISRVKSVNLDAWTPEHVAYVQRMGNSRARAIYEANLPDDFRRPQTDTALESFIRAKYEHKRYIAQNYVDPGPPEPAFDADEELRRMKEQKRSKLSSGINKTMISVSDTFAAPANNQTSGRSIDISSSAKPRTTPSYSASLSQQQPQIDAESSELTSMNKSAATTVSSKPKSNLADLMDLDMGFGTQNISSNITANTFNSMNSSSNSFDTSSAFNFASSFAAPTATPTLPQQSTNLASLTGFSSPTVLSTPLSSQSFMDSSSLFSVGAINDTSKIQNPITKNPDPPVSKSNLTTGNAGNNVFDLLDL